MSEVSIHIQPQGSSLLPASVTPDPPKRVKESLAFALLVINIYVQLLVILVLGCGGPIRPNFHAKDVFRNIFFSNFLIELLYACFTGLYVSVIHSRSQRQAVIEKESGTEKGRAKKETYGEDERTVLKNTFEGVLANDHDNTAATCLWGWFWASTIIWPVSLGGMIWTGYWMEVRVSFVEMNYEKKAV